MCNTLKTRKKYSLNDLYIINCISRLTRTEEDLHESIDSSHSERVMISIEGT